MRKNMIFISSFVVFTVLLLSAIGYAAPKIACDEPVWEFEKALEGERVNHKFIVKNTGNEDLEITNVRASCGCTAVKPQSKLLKPGEETKIETKFNTTGRSGKQSKNVYVHTNDPEQKIFKLVIKGEIQRKPAPRIILRPPSWNLQTIDPGKTYNNIVTIMNTGEEPLVIESIETSKECVTATLKGEKTVKPDGNVQLTMSFTPGFGDTNIRERITINSNDPKRRRVNYHIYGRLDLDARGLTFSLIDMKKQGEDTLIDLYVRNNESEPLTFKVPLAKAPNQTTIPPKNSRKFSVTLPGNLGSKENASTAGNNVSPEELKIEISLPLPQNTSGKTSAVKLEESSNLKKRIIMKEREGSNPIVPGMTPKIIKKP